MSIVIVFNKSCDKKRNFLRGLKRDTLFGNKFPQKMANMGPILYFYYLTEDRTIDIEKRVE